MSDVTEKQNAQLYILGHGVGFIIFYFLLSIYYKMLMNKLFPQINAQFHLAVIEAGARRRRAFRASNRKSKSLPL